MPDFLTAKRGELCDRRDELAPMAAEHGRIVEAIDALDRAVPSSAAASSNGSSTQPRRRGPGRPRASAKPARPRTRGAGRKKGSGKRGAEALDIIRAASADGISLQGVADKLGIKPNYLYRVLPPMEAEGKIKKCADGTYVAVS
jgi:hypothetical protein